MTEFPDKNPRKCHGDAELCFLCWNDDQLECISDSIDDIVETWTSSTISSSSFERPCESFSVANKVDISTLSDSSEFNDDIDFTTLEGIPNFNKIPESLIVIGTYNEEALQPLKKEMQTNMIKYFQKHDEDLEIRMKELKMSTDSDCNETTITEPSNALSSALRTNDRGEIFAKGSQTQREQDSFEKRTEIAGHTIKQAAIDKHFVHQYIDSKTEKNSKTKAKLSSTTTNSISSEQYELNCKDKNEPILATQNYATEHLHDISQPDQFDIDEKLYAEKDVNSFVRTQRLKWLRRLETEQQINQEQRQCGKTDIVSHRNDKTKGEQEHSSINIRKEAVSKTTIRKSILSGKAHLAKVDADSVMNDSSQTSTTEEPTAMKYLRQLEETAAEKSKVADQQNGTKNTEEVYKKADTNMVDLLFLGHQTILTECIKDSFENSKGIVYESVFEQNAKIPKLGSKCCAPRGKISDSSDKNLDDVKLLKSEIATTGKDSETNQLKTQVHRNKKHMKKTHSNKNLRIKKSNTSYVCDSQRTPTLNQTKPKSQERRMAKFHEKRPPNRPDVTFTKIAESSSQENKQCIGKLINDQLKVQFYKENILGMV